MHQNTHHFTYICIGSRKSQLYFGYCKSQNSGPMQISRAGELKVSLEPTPFHEYIMLSLVSNINLQKQFKFSKL